MPSWKHPDCESLTVVTLNSSERAIGLQDLGYRIVRDLIGVETAIPVNAIIVVYHSTLRPMGIDDFCMIQSSIQERCHALKVPCTSSILFRGNGPSFEIVVDQWYPTTISFYDQFRFDLRATRGLINYSIIQVHEGPSEYQPNSGD